MDRIVYFIKETRMQKKGTIPDRDVPSFFTCESRIFGGGACQVIQVLVRLPEKAKSGIGQNPESPMKIKNGTGQAAGGGTKMPQQEEGCTGKRQRGKGWLTRRKAIRNARQKARQDMEQKVRQEAAFQTEIQNLLTELAKQGFEDFYTMFEEGVRAYIEPFEEIWQQCFPYPDFHGYREETYVQMLLEQGNLFHMMIVGYHGCLPWVLKGRVRRLKSLRLVLTEMSTECEEWLDMLYEEYGLAASVTLVDNYRRAVLSCAVPSMILDFSSEGHLLTHQVAKGSIWLDMDSLEEKRVRIEGRNTGIMYFSLRKLWRQ